jgi:hypothetical protein
MMALFPETADDGVQAAIAMHWPTLRSQRSLMNSNSTQFR